MSMLLEIVFVIIMIWLIVEAIRFRWILGSRGATLFVTALILCLLAGEVPHRISQQGLVNGTWTAALLIAIWACVDATSFIRLERLRKDGELHKANFYDKIFHKKYLITHMGSGDKKPHRDDE